MTWNYRICKETTDDGVVEYTLREAYYNDKFEITAVSIDSNSEFMSHLEGGDDDDAAIQEVKSHIDKLVEATKKEVVDLDNITFSNWE